MSASFEKTGTGIVAASRYPENTHEYSLRPPSWPMIVSIAVPTTLESSAARLSAVRIEAVITNCPRVIGGAGSKASPTGGGGGGGREVGAGGGRRRGRRSGRGPGRPRAGGQGHEGQSVRR